MPASEITAIAPARTANEFADTAANVDGNWFVNDGRQLLVIHHTNVGGADMTLTIVTQLTVDAEPVDDKEIAIVKGKRYLIGPFPTGFYNDGDGYVQMTYSAETDLTVGVIKLT